MSNLKLVYFDTKGNAETSRLILKISGVNFEDFRYPLEVVNSDSENLYRKPEFDRDVKLGLLEKSMNKLPYLEIKKSDKIDILLQSKSIERYLAKKYDLMGKTLYEEAKIDSICECVRDIHEEYKKLSNYQKLKSDREKNNYFTIKLKDELEKLTSILDPENTPYSVGERLSLADISIYVLITVLFNDHKSIVFDVAGRIKKIRNIVIKVSNLSAVREWTRKYPV